jgi:hypothetical protein
LQPFKLARVEFSIADKGFFRLMGPDADTFPLSVVIRSMTQ